MAPKPFDPNTAPKAVMTGDERAAIQKDMNNLALRLRDAAGIILYEYKIQDLVPYWNPFGFDFKAARWQELLKAANGAKGLGFDPIDMPGVDMWLRGNIMSAGFTQIGKSPHVHLDIATNRPGLCRLYLLDDGTSRRMDTLRRAAIVSERQSDVFKKIYQRMKGLGIDLDDHIDSHLEAGRLVLDGINFVAKDHKRLLAALTDLKYPAGDNVFFRGAKSARGHFVGTPLSWPPTVSASGKSGRLFQPSARSRRPMPQTVRPWIRKPRRALEIPRTCPISPRCIAPCQSGCATSTSTKWDS